MTPGNTGIRSYYREKCVMHSGGLSRSSLHGRGVKPGKRTIPSFWRDDSLFGSETNFAQMRWYGAIRAPVSSESRLEGPIPAIPCCVVMGVGGITRGGVRLNRTTDAAALSQSPLWLWHRAEVFVAIPRP